MTNRRDANRTAEYIPAQQQIPAVQNHHKKIRDTWLNKPAPLIECEGRLTAQQRHMFNAMLYNSLPNLDDTWQEISIRRLKELSGIKTRNHKWLHEALDELQRIQIEWDVFNEKRNTRYNKSTPFSDVKEMGDRPVVRYALSAETKDQLRSPEMYAKLYLMLGNNLVSKFSVALWELGLRYEGVGRTKEQELDTWRHVFGVMDTHKSFSDFRTKVLEPAKAEVEEKTDLSVEYQYRKTGRRVTHLRIMFRRAKQPQSEDPRVLYLVKDLRTQTQMSEDAAFDLIHEHGADLVQKTLDDMVKSAAYARGAIRNKAGFLVKAINEGWELKPAETQSMGPAPLPPGVKSSMDLPENQPKRTPEEEHAANEITAWRNRMLTMISQMTSEELEALGRHVMQSGLLSRVRWNFASADITQASTAEQWFIAHAAAEVFPELPQPPEPAE